MRNEARRLALIKLQSMIAGRARYEAMRALAAALEEERRTAQLAARTLALLRAGGQAEIPATGEALAMRARFGAGLGRIAGDAASARGDAARHAAWQADALAAAEARAKRLAEMETAAARALETALARRDAGTPAAMARKLHDPPSAIPATSSKG